MTGNIKLLAEGESAPVMMPQVPESSYIPLDKHDTYKEFKLRGYNYTGDFQGIEKIDNEGMEYLRSRFVHLQVCSFIHSSVQECGLMLPGRDPGQAS